MTQALPLPPLEVLQKKFIYNPETGELIHRENTRRLRAGDTAGYPTQRGWLRVKVDGTHYRVHRIAWKMHYGEDPPQGLDIDHINQVKTDNRISNLRLATRSENVQNTPRVINKKPPKPRKTPEELAEIRKNASAKLKKPIALVRPCGQQMLFSSVSEALATENLSAQDLYHLLQGKRKQHKGYTARYA